MIIAQCPVCQELLEGGTSDFCLSALHCGHVFHAVCIDTWMRTSSTCPQCRVAVARRQTIKRLYFCLVDRASTSLLLPELSSSITDGNNFQSSPSKDFSSSDTASLGIALRKARCEITRLTNQVSALKEQASLDGKKVIEKDAELQTITCLYTEVDKLYSIEKQKYRQTKLELSGYQKALQEAETIKSEGLELRKQMNEMRDLQALIGSSDKAANEILFRYTGETNSTSTSVDTSLITACRWAAVLRSELSSARSKCRKYRSGVHRLQKLQANSTRRVLAAESSAAEQKELVLHLQDELTQLRTKSIPGSSNTLSLSPSNQSRTFDVQNSGIQISSTPIQLESNFNATPYSADNLGLRSCLKYVDLSTPDISALAERPWSDRKKISLISPDVNPFKMSTSSAPTPETVLKIQRSDSFPETSLMTSRRRPSSLFQLSIMRNYKGVLPANNYAYNGLGGQTQQMEHDSLANRESFTSSSLKRFMPSKQMSNRTHKKSVNVFRLSKTTKLDHFLRPV